ncbi:MurR/RpiR family transcriptional regulator [Sulfobacillus harzensis]|uniref:MurR/RpiR family transcriptional regulator n=1 Tax=Sulfobacillus harzensis TaxID=2729629 RepID=UPI0030843843
MPIAGVLERIESNLDLLTGSEAKIAQWILENPETVLRLTVRDLARESNSSQAAVIRLLRTLKIDGYSTLKVLLTADLVRQEQRSSPEYTEINPGASFDSQLQSFAHAAEDSIYQTINNLNEADLARVSERLRSAHHVFLFGMAASHIAAEDLAQKLTRLGFPVTCWRDIHLAVMASALLGSEDVAVLVSFSGATREVLELATELREREAFIVAITQYRPKNRLAELADVVFHVSAQEPTPRIGATTSVLASLLIGDALMLWLANQDATRTLRHLKATEEAIRQHRV